MIAKNFWLSSAFLCVLIAQVLYSQEVQQVASFPLDFSAPDHAYPRFVVLIPSYNNEKNFFKGESVYKLNLKALFEQTYPYYRVIYINDASTDRTGEVVQEMVRELGQEHRFTMINNKTNQGQLANCYYATHACADDEIIVRYDGDDWFAHKHVLHQLSLVYQNKSVWMTYGQLRRACDDCIATYQEPYYQATAGCCHPPYDSSICMPLPSKEIIERNKLREYIVNQRPGTSWVFGALRTYYAGLFNRIRIEDLKTNGQFYVIGEDVVATIYMAEMAGKHIQFIPDVLYIYNWNNHRSRKDTDYVRPQFWLKEMQERKKYEPLDELGVDLAAQDDAERFYIARSIADFRSGDFQGAIQASLCALKLNPSSATAYNNISVSQLELGNLSDAYAAAGMALIFNPGLEIAQNNMAFIRSLFAK